jgi:hypothetical protein
MEIEADLLSEPATLSAIVRKGGTYLLWELITSLNALHLRSPIVLDLYLRG